MIRTVAKHRYFKGKNATLSVRQYIGYVAFRGGPDARASGRNFFDEDSDSISFAKVKAEFAYKPVPGQSVLTHELILSPGVQSVDAQRYTRVLMDKLERSMGRNLKWAAVSHKGKHNHIHVFIDGRDKNERRVYLRKEEYTRLREWGDKYIQNEHGLERYLRKEVDLDEPFEREKGDALYETLFQNNEQKQELQESQAASTSKIFGAWEKSKAVAELADEDKVYFAGKAFHQFNTTRELYSLLKRSGDKLSDDQVAMVKQWIVDKESFGDDHHERLERESLVRQRRRRRIPRKNKKQEDKESARKRGKEDIAVKIERKSSGDKTHQVGDIVAEETKLADSELSLQEPEEEEIESQIHVRRLVEERIARLKVEDEETRELEERLGKESHELKKLDLKTSADLLNATQQNPFDGVLQIEAQEDIKQLERTTEQERQNVELKLEQERNTRISASNYRAILQGFRGYLNSRSASGLMRQPRIQRRLHENDREKLWQGRYTGAANQADLHELQDMNTDSLIDGTSSLRDKPDLEPSQNQSLSTANYEHRHPQPSAEHPLSLQAERSETLEDLMGLDTNHSTEKTNNEKENPSDQTQHKNRNNDSTERDEDEWKR